MQNTIESPRFRWLVLLAASMTYISLCNLLAFPAVLPIISKDLGISMAAATHFLSFPLLIAAISLVFTGVFADRFGILPSLILGLLCAAVPSVLMPWLGTSYMPVLIIRCFQGFVAGFAFCVMSPIVAIWFPLKEKGLAAGIMGASVSVGALGVVAAPYICLATRTWQEMVAWLTVPAWIGLIITLIAWWRQPPLPVQAHTEQVDSSSYKRALKTPITWIGVFVTFFAAWVMQCLYNLTPAYFASDIPMGTGFGPVLSGKFMIAVMGAGIIGPVIAGLLQDKVFGGNSKPVMLMGFVLCAIFTYLIVVPSVYMNSTLLVACLVLTGAGTQFTYTLIPVYVSRTYPVSITAKVIGLWMGLGMFGGVAGVGLGGLAVARSGSYYGGMVMTALAAAAGIILVCFLKALKQTGEEVQ